MILTQRLRRRTLVHAEDGRIRVMLVDDNPHFLKVASQWISDQPGLQLVSTAENGKEALEKLEKIAIDLLLIDVAMPVMNGLEATTRVKAMPEAPKVVMVSMYDIDIEGLAAGADGFANKPNFVDLIPQLVESIFHPGCRVESSAEASIEKTVSNTIPQSQLAEG
jgi:CheY-like chemotaxis protein